MENARELISGYDLVAGGSDNFSTRYLVADQCAALKVPLVTAAVGTFRRFRDGAETYEGENPSYRDLFPAPPPVERFAADREQR